ncbi:sporulation integral membrane protein YtvI [Anaerobacillus alkaliphilus]|uniref:Sporulation integral membrane protein YtvI n=1 Tax=Anaerobacillus alkaliphilus TaxID=1548597 RepID=A0A4Q0VPW6_9BACI|nr:sporulation integral membrane protein YtvI [Anaerobacillus alkaliphilus]RXI98526.1 sporulation integral membrane protein YtvI [Anaerobacillus alkaliphilus]
MNSNYFQILLRLTLVVSIIFLIAVLGFITFKTAYPFMIGLVLAFFLNPIVNFFQERMKISRWLSVSIVLLGLLSLTIGSITILISEIIMGTNYLSQSVPIHFQSLIYEFQKIFTGKIMPIYEQISTIFYSLDSDQQVTIKAYVETITNHITSNASSTIQSVLTGISDFLLALPNLATVIIFSLLATFFISKDWYKLVFIFRKWLPNVIAERTKDVMKSLKKAFVGFILAQITLISITCCIVLIGLLVLKVDYPITIALIIAFVDLLPYLGTGLIFIPWILYTFFSGQLSLTIGLSILYGVVVVQRQIMEPKILSSSIGVDPLATLVSLFVGYKLFGFLGLILGPIILVFIQTLHNAHVFRDLRNYIFKIN